MNKSSGVSVVEVTGLAASARLFAKDETQNNAGSHKRRAASAVSRAAAADSCSCVVVGSCGKYGLAVSLAAREVGLDSIVVVPTTARVAISQIERIGGTVEVVNGSYEDAIAVSKRLCVDKRLADGNVDGPYAGHVMEALAEIGHDLARCLEAPPRAVWLPVGDGTTTVALARAFAELSWPTSVVGVTSTGNNSILASWPGRRHVPVQRENVRLTAVREPLVNWRALYGQEALDALNRTGGLVVGVTDNELVGAQNVLGQFGLLTSPAGAAGIAGFTTNNRLFESDATHVAILTGR